jgi:hypothetical protein
MRGLILLLSFLALLAEKPTDRTYTGLWSTLLTPLGTALFTSLPILRLPLWDLLVVGLLVLTVLQPASWGGRARPLDHSLGVSLAGVALALIWGLLRGGSFYQAFFQIHVFGMVLCLSLLFLATLRTRQALRSLERMIFWAAIVRAALVLLFFFQVVKPTNPKPYPTYMTTHDDTVLFVVGLIIPVAGAMARRGLGAWLKALVPMPLFLYAIYLNQRRVAWVSLGASLALMYLFLDVRSRRRFNRVGLLLAPVLVLYVTLGWGRPGTLFAPLRSLATMSGTTDDESTKSRDVENHGLVLTYALHPVLGTGFGHEYEETSTLYSQGMEKIFPQYAYMPHNSLLGVLAFAGIVGFALIWLPFWITSLLLKRTIVRAPRARDRATLLWAVAGLVAYLSQCYADMGFQSLTGGIVAAAAIAVAGRLSVRIGAWPEKARGTGRIPPAPPLAPSRPLSFPLAPPR